MVKKYMALVNIDPDWAAQAKDYLFRPLVFKKSLNLHVLRDGKRSYSTCRDLFKQALSAIGLNAPDFGLHSLWASGALAAAAVGVPDRLFKKHGRWMSESAKDGYVKESLDSQLSVSLSLGI